MNKKINGKTERGQSLVEFGFTFPIFLMVILLTIDPFLFAVDLAIAKYYSFYAAREASLFLVDGTNSCQGTVAAVVSSLPPLFNADGLSSTVYDPTECTNDPSDDVPRGDQVEVTINFDYHPVWWGGTWTGQMSTINIYQ